MKWYTPVFACVREFARVRRVYKQEKRLHDAQVYANKYDDEGRPYPVKSQEE